MQAKKDKRGDDVVFIFRAAVAYATNLNQFQGYEMVDLKGGKYSTVKFSDLRTQFDRLLALYPGIEKEKAEVFAKFSLDGKNYAYGRIVEVGMREGKDGGVAIGMETKDENGKAKVEYLIFQFGGETGIKLDKVYHGERIGNEFGEELKELKNCKFSLLAVQKNGKIEEWKDSPSAVYSSRMQSLASIIQPGLSGETLGGKSITIEDPSNPAMTIAVSVLNPCWTEGLALVANKKNKLKQVLDFNSVTVESVLDK